MKRRARISCLTVLVCLLGGSIAVAGDEPGPSIGEGTVASIEYTLTDDKGVQIETSEGGEPVTYTHGESSVVPGLRKALIGLHKGDEREVKLTPEEGFGKVDPDAFQEIPKEKLPTDAFRVGAMLRAESPDGVVLPVRVSEVKEASAIVDFNHPLAGKALTFRIKVLDVRKAEAAETAPAKP